MSRTFDSSICDRCLLICLDNSIFCNICNTWLHAKCAKLTLRQLKDLSDTDIPYFCSKCVSSALPFSDVTNRYLDHFNSLVYPGCHDTKYLKCTKCLKIIHSKDKIKCKLGNHFLHTKCGKIVDINNINKTLWSCNECLLFPFYDLDDTSFAHEINTNNIDPNQRKARTILTNTITELKSNLPKLEIPDPSDIENNLIINFDYYDIHKFLKMLSRLNNNSNISFLHTNVRSYHKNFDELNALLSKIPFKFDFIGLTETWDSPAKPIPHQTLDEYHPIETEQGVSQNGGVGVYVNKKIEFTRREDLKLNMNTGKDDQCENLFLELKGSNNQNSLVVGVIYRHPNGRISKFFNEMEKTLISKLTKNTKK